MVAAARLDETAALWAVLEQVPDPEIPVISVVELGIVRSVEPDRVVITPTYTGCPATQVIERDIRSALDAAGYRGVRIETALSPAWTTDWITPEGRAALAAAGISPPGPAPSTSGPIPLTLLPTARQVRCPQCDSSATELVSEFGSTACKAQYRCTVCLEPFDHVKEI